MSNQLEQYSNNENIQTSQLHNQFAKLLNRIINLGGDEMFEEFNQTILQKCRESNKESFKVLSDLIESIIKNLLNKLEAAQALLQMDINKSDYQILQTAAQKAEAEVRTLFRIQHQQKIYQQELEEKVRTQQIQLLKAQNKIKILQSNIERYERQNKKMSSKIQKFQQKMYQVNRDGRWGSVDKSYDQLINKASLNLKQKQKQKLEPYLQSATKSKHMISRKKDAYKLFKERGSKILCFDSLKSKHQCSDSQIMIRGRHSISQHASKIGSGIAFSQINQSIQMLQPDKKRKKRLLKQVTEMSDKNNNRSSLYL